MPLQPMTPANATVPENTRTAPVQEIFSSIQGEAQCIGQRQVFVRFAHCHLHCAYCDTPMHTPDGRCHVETVPGSGTTRAEDNPLSAEALLSLIQPLLQTAPHHSVSLTGGEPLLYHALLADLLPRLQPLCPVYLETSGTQPDFLTPLLSHIDWIAMDVKLPSTTGEAPQWEAHQAFYALAQSQLKPPQLFIKCIVSDATTTEELEHLKAIVTHPATPVYLQPETTLDGSLAVKATPATLLTLQAHLAQTFHEVRVVPQSHKMLRVL
ncbi:MAG: 7-carboxy-7-deazaguanine synthase QueE [Candidatus Melainabacteria bacterium]